MVFKILYQDNYEEMPLRERTRSMYVEAESVREVRNKLKDRNYNIEYIQELDEAHLNYEKKSEDFRVENL